MITKALSFVLPLSFLSAVSALRPASLTGQAPASVKPGSAIRITLKSSRRFEATFVGLSQDSLQWRLGYGPAALHGAVPRDSIALWEIRRGGAGPLGAVIGLQHLDSRHHLEPPPVVGRATRGANIRLADAAPARCRKSRLFMAERYDQVRHGGEPVFFPKSTRASCHPEGRRPEGSATHGHCRHLGSCLPSHFFLRSTPCTVSCSLA